MNRNNFIIFKILIKNDFNKILIWLSSIISITLLSAYAYPGLYTTNESILGYANIMVNPAMKGMLGGSYPTEAFNHAVIFSQELLMFTAIAVAVMNIYFTVKYVKVAEDDGITEVVNSKPISRFTYLTSSIILILLLNIIIFIITSFGLSLINLNGSNFLGSVYYGLLLALIGIIFSGIGYIACKLYNNSSSSYTFSYLTLLIFYIIRAIGDVTNDNISLFSPFGLMTKVQVFYNNNIIYILVLILLSIVLYILSFYLFEKIDYKSGVFNSNNGKAKASKTILSSFGLIFSLVKTQIFVWTFSLFILTAAFGAIFGEFEVFLEIDIVKQFLGGEEIDFSKNIIIYVIKIIAMFGFIPSLLVILKMGKEENKSYIDNIYTRNYSRIRYLINHILFAVLLSIIIQLIIIFGVFITGRDFIISTMPFSKLIKISLSFLPAIWVVLGLATFLLSLGRKYLKAIWIYFGFLFITMYFEEILDLPKWIMNISSFYHVNTTDFNFTNNFIMILISIILFSFSILLYKKRDME